MGLTGGNLMRAVTHGDDFQTDPGYAASMQADAACSGGGEVYQAIAVKGPAVVDSDDG